MSNNVSEQNSPPRKTQPFYGKGDPAANEINTVNSAAVKPREETPRFVAPTHGGVDILKLLTELEDLVENTRHGPLGVMLGFPEDQFHMTIMKIRANLPEEMKRASKLAREQERIVEETRADAERIKEEARKAALSDFEQGKAELVQLREQAKVEAEQLKMEAMQEAEQIHAGAEREAQQIRAEADAHGRQILSDAKAQAARLVSENEIVHQAQAMAQDLQLQAEQEAAAVRHGADDYARTVLINLENVLGKAITQVQRGREILERPR